MDETSSPDPFIEAGPLIWLLALLVAMLAAHVAMGYVRQVEREPRLRMKLLFASASAFGFGTGVWSAMLLGLSCQTPSFMLGYSLGRLALAWGWAVLSALPAAAVLARWQRGWSVAAAGAMLVASTLVTGVLAVRALGLQPGFAWQPDALVLAVPATASGCVGGLWIGFLGGGRNGAQRRLWRVGAAAMIAFAVVVGLSLVLSAVPFESQNDSAFRKQLPSVVVALGGGIGIPLLLLGLAFDLRLRRYAPAPGTPPPRKRRRRRRI